MTLWFRGKEVELGRGMMSAGAGRYNTMQPKRPYNTAGLLWPRMGLTRIIALLQLEFAGRADYMR
jgi:hypothetical protein